MSRDLYKAFMHGFNTTVNSQDTANDNTYRTTMTRLAFEVGAYFMRAKLPGPTRVERGVRFGQHTTLFVDGKRYYVTSTDGGILVNVIEQGEQ